MGATIVNDLIKGAFLSEEELDDLVIERRTATTYNFAVVIDDARWHYPSHPGMTM